MSDEIENKTGYQAQSSETMNEYSGAAVGDIDYVRLQNYQNKICTMDIHF